MLDYRSSVSNETARNNSEVVIEEVLQHPGLVNLFVGYPRWLLYFAAACCALFMLIGIPGNLMTLIALFRTKKLRNATAVFIMNLSISDLMFCCFNLPLATSTFWHSSWLHGPLLCRLFPLLRYGLVAVSLFTVLAITINRYIMIGHPGLYPALYKTRNLIPMILAIWIVSFGVLIITWFERWGRFGLDPAIGSCSILPDVNGRSPKEFLFVLAFLIPCLAIIVCYARIFCIVRKTAARSRGGNKIVKIVGSAENSHEPQSVSRNQEEELAVLCTSSSPMQAIFLRPPDEETDLSSRTLDENSSCSKRSVRDRRQTNHAVASRLNTFATDADDHRSDAHSNCNYDTSPASLTTAEDALFVDDSETKRFLNDDRVTNELRLNASKITNRLTMTRRASSIAESSLWPRGIANRSHLHVTSSSHSPERFTAKCASRRESRFRGVVGMARNDESVPRMSAKDRKLLQMILVIFSSFLVCYLPITVTKLFRNEVDWRGLNIAGYILIYLTTCINPVIYVVMSSEYRSAYKYVLLCKRERMASEKRTPVLPTSS